MVVRYRDGDKHNGYVPAVLVEEFVLQKDLFPLLKGRRCFI